jgi:hypothetical protein
VFKSECQGRHLVRNSVAQRGSRDRIVLGQSMNRRAYEQGDGQKAKQETNTVYKKTGGAIRGYRECFAEKLIFYFN